MATYNLRAGLTPANVGVIFIDSQRTLDLNRQFTENATMYAPDADAGAVRVLDGLVPGTLTKITDNPAANEARYLQPVLALIPYTAAGSPVVRRTSDGVFEGSPTSITLSDVNLYRSAANVLKTDDTFHGAADVLGNAGHTTRQIALTALGTKAFLRFGTAGVDQFDKAGIWLEDAGTIRTNTYFSFEGGMITPVMQFGYAAAPGTIVLSETSGNFDVSLGGIQCSGGLGVNGTSAIAKPTVTGSRASNAALTSLLTALANYGLITNSTSA